MSGLAFFDSNVLVYADDERSPEKQARAKALFARHFDNDTAVFSVQVLQEYYAVATRRLAVSPEIAQRKVELFASGRIVRFSGDDVVSAIRLQRALRLSIWDAL